MMAQWVGDTSWRMAAQPSHRRWLLAQIDALIWFYSRSVNSEGGFFTLDARGSPLSQGELHDVCRLIHCFSAAHLLGHPSGAEMVDHGLRSLQYHHQDAERGGYYWSVGRRDKLAYGHAFVLLAAASAGAVGHPGARDLYEDIIGIIRARFWDDAAGAMTEQYDAQWVPLDGYRGMNSNMHMLEALLAANDTWPTTDLIAMGLRIADLFINRHARAAGWVIPEHYDENWQVDRSYEGDPMFRPAGTTPGHALEWSRLLVQLWHADGRRKDWLPDASRALFVNAVAHGWSHENQALHYTLNWDQRPLRRQNYWWPMAEGAAAADVLGRVLGGAEFEHWYRLFWQSLDRRFIDHRNGGWWHEVSPDGSPAQTVFHGKPDMYHAFQACLIPLVPAEAGILAGLAKGIETAGHGE